MNAKLGIRLIEIAKAMKAQKATGRAFHVSAITKGRKIMCLGWNNYLKGHSSKRFGKYDNWRNLPNEYLPCRHAETDALIKFGETDLSDYTIINVRVSNNQEIKLSKPCPNCQRVLLETNCRRIFYSTNEGSFEELR